MSKPHSHKNLFRSFAFTLMLLSTSNTSACALQQRKDESLVPRVHKPPREIFNAGFELGEAYWKPVSDGLINARVLSDSTQAHEGRRSLKIDLRNSAVLEKDASFFLLTPWLALEQGGTVSFTLFARSEQPRAKLALRVFHATSNEALSKGTQEQKSLGRDFALTAAWQSYRLEGQLPAAEKDNYRFALRFEAGAVYGIDAVEILWNGKPLTRKPNVEAALLPPQELLQPLGKVETTLRLLNRTAQEQRLQFHAVMKARQRRNETKLEKKFVLTAEQALLERVPFELPHGDVYEIAWQLLEENGTLIQKDQIRLAARGVDLPPVLRGRAEWGMHLNSNNLERVLPTLRNAGIRHLRNVMSLHWESVEPSPQNWQWPEALSDYLQQNDFIVLGKLGFTPKWAVPPENAKGWPIQNQMPASLAAFRTYVRETVAHYQDRITCWEVWNEPNLPRYFAGTPAQYGEVLASAIAEIKATQPTAEIAGFAVAQFYKPETMDFFRAAITSQPDLRVSAVSFHPYFNHSPEQAGLVQRIGEVNEVFETLRGNNPHFWITEYGYQNTELLNTALASQPPLRPNLIDEMTMASYLVRTACLAKLAGVKYFFCYAMDSERVNRGADLFGLLESSWQGAPKPGLLAYLTLAQLLSDANYEEREHLNNPEIYLLHFRRSDQRRVSVLWQATGTSSFSLPASLRQTEAFDLFGNRFETARSSNVSLSGQPIFFLAH